MSRDPAGQPDSASDAALTVRRIVDATIELIDRDGLPALTMRGIGTALGVEAMALYYHVGSRDLLLDAVVDQVISDLHGEPDIRVTDDGWQGYLTRIAHGVRRIAVAHPRVFPLVATRPPEAPWVRPPLRSLRWMESFLASLGACGFSPEAAVAAYRSFSSFLLGQLLVEVAGRGVEIGPVADASPDVDRADLREYPALAAARPLLSQDHSEAEFAEALSALVRRLRPLDRPTEPDRNGS